MDRGRWVIPSNRTVGIAMSPRSVKHRPECLSDVTLTQGRISDPYHLVPSMGPIFLVVDFTWSEKPVLEKQTSQLSLVM